MLVRLLERRQLLRLMADQTIAARLRVEVDRVGRERPNFPAPGKEVKSADNHNHNGNKQQIACFHGESPGVHKLSRFEFN